MNNDYKFISLDESRDGKTKYMATFINLNTGKIKTVRFGSYGYGDFPYWVQEIGLEKAKIKKRNYLARHLPREDWTDLISRGALSRYILWSKPTIEESFNDYINKFE